MKVGHRQTPYNEKAPPEMVGLFYPDIFYLCQLNSDMPGIGARSATFWHRTLSDAGWSSSVARRAHNPKVIGSNPVPATRFTLRRINAVMRNKRFKL